jgi:hypothetical protein
MVPGEESGPNVCRFGLSGWRSREVDGNEALLAFQIEGRNRTKRAFGLVTLEHVVQNCANFSREQHSGRAN